jgi:ferredoxin
MRITQLLTKESLAMIKVEVDFDRCDANGTCAALMPDVFRIGEDGLLEQLKTEVEDDSAEDLQEVILCCPLGAISRS